MGITVVLEDENGGSIETLDDTTLLLRALPRVDDASFPWMSTIDRYGDTTFNHLQVVRAGLQRLIRASSAPETTAHLQRIDALFERCVSEPHLYVKFYGDYTWPHLRGRTGGSEAGASRGRRSHRRDADDPPTLGDFRAPPRLASRSDPDASNRLTTDSER
jgi:hypothetical protein